MYIERVQVEEGFLDDLDLALSPGLNVIIGPRGSGKTSLVEIIRFCLNAPAFTDDAETRGRQQALSVLGSGRVTVTLNDDGERLVVVRSASDERPRVSVRLPEVTVLAQGEIEVVGSQASGRAHLLDRLRSDRSAIERDGARALIELRSLMAEIEGLLAEIDDAESAALGLSDAPAAMKEAEEHEQEVLGSIKATKEDQQRLKELQAKASEVSVQAGALERARQQIESFREAIVATAARPPLVDSWPEAAGQPDLLEQSRATVQRVVGILGDLATEIVEEHRHIASISASVERQSIEIDDETRDLRRRLDALEAGFGEITRQVGELRERVGQLDALNQRASDLRERLAGLLAQRDGVYRDVDGFRQTRFAQRDEVARRLNAELGPEIDVEIVRSGRTGSYARAIIEALRGSGLHYNTLAPRLAANMSPLELVEAVETSEAGAIAAAAEITESRAAGLLAALRGASRVEILSAPIEDDVVLRLLDGSEYKPSDQVSIGQRCTIVLPILLSRHGGILIVDQPEDHLDNSFVADTVVPALQKRHSGDQLIFVSHNANIPVLGEADWIVSLDSDGRRAHVKSSAGLDDAESVQAITEVLEGGAEAFGKRAAFYSGRDVSPDDE